MSMSTPIVGFEPASTDIPLLDQPKSSCNYPEAGDGNHAQVQRGLPICPPGLEYLAMVDQVLIHQKVELLEVLLGCETKNRYTIKNSLGQFVYEAKEDTGCCNRNCLGTIRPFDLRITNHHEEEVITLHRDLRCQGCCCPCCLQELDVLSPSGGLLGRIIQEWSFLTPKFHVENASGETVFRIVGPFCVISCFSDVHFRIFAKDESEVGTITKQWTGLIREAFTDADHFGVTFPLNLDVSMKAVLLGACFLIDFMYFEKPGGN